MKLLVVSLFFLALGCASKPAPTAPVPNACGLKPSEPPTVVVDPDFDGMPIILSEGIKCLVWRVEGQNRVAYIYRRGENRTVRVPISMEPDILAMLIHLEKTFVAANPGARSRKLWTICRSIETENGSTI